MASTTTIDFNIIASSDTSKLKDLQNALLQVAATAEGLQENNTFELNTSDLEDYRGTWKLLTDDVKSFAKSLGNVLNSLSREHLQLVDKERIRDDMQALLEGKEVFEGFIETIHNNSAHKPISTEALTDYSDKVATVTTVFREGIEILSQFNNSQSQLSGIDLVHKAMNKMREVMKLGNVNDGTQNQTLSKAVEEVRKALDIASAGNPNFDPKPYKDLLSTVALASQGYNRLTHATTLQLKGLNLNTLGDYAANLLAGAQDVNEAGTILTEGMRRLRIAFDEPPIAEGLVKNNTGERAQQLRDWIGAILRATNALTTSDAPDQLRKHFTRIRETLTNFADLTLRPGWTEDYAKSLNVDPGALDAYLNQTRDYLRITQDLNTARKQAVATIETLEAAKQKAAKSPKTVANIQGLIDEARGTIDKYDIQQADLERRLLTSTQAVLGSQVSAQVTALNRNPVVTYQTWDDIENAFVHDIQKRLKTNAESIPDWIIPDKAQFAEINERTLAEAEQRTREAFAMVRQGIPLPIPNENLAAYIDAKHNADRALAQVPPNYKPQLYPDIFLYDANERKEWRPPEFYQQQRQAAATAAGKTPPEAEVSAPDPQIAAQTAEQQKIKTKAKKEEVQLNAQLKQQQDDLNQQAAKNAQIAGQATQHAQQTTAATEDQQQAQDDLTRSIQMTDEAYDALRNKHNIPRNVDRQALQELDDYYNNFIDPQNSDERMRKLMDTEYNVRRLMLDPKTTRETAEARVFARMDEQEARQQWLDTPIDQKLLLNATNPARETRFQEAARIAADEKAAAATAEARKKAQLESLRIMREQLATQQSLNAASGDQSGLIDKTTDRLKKLAEKTADPLAKQDILKFVDQIQGVNTQLKDTRSLSAAASLEVSQLGDEFVQLDRDLLKAAASQSDVIHKTSGHPGDPLGEQTFQRQVSTLDKQRKDLQKRLGTDMSTLQDQGRLISQYQKQIAELKATPGNEDAIATLNQGLLRSDTLFKKSSDNIQKYKNDFGQLYLNILEVGRALPNAMVGIKAFEQYNAAIEQLRNHPLTLQKVLTPDQVTPNGPLKNLFDNPVAIESNQRLIDNQRELRVAFDRSKDTAAQLSATIDNLIQNGHRYNSTAEGMAEGTKVAANAIRLMNEAGRDQEEISDRVATSLRELNLMMGLLDERTTYITPEQKNQIRQHIDDLEALQREIQDTRKETDKLTQAQIDQIDGETRKRIQANNDKIKADKAKEEEEQKKRIAELYPESGIKAFSKRFFGGNMFDTLITGAVLSLGRKVEEALFDVMRLIGAAIKDTARAYDDASRAAFGFFALMPEQSERAKEKILADIQDISQAYGIANQEALEASTKAYQFGVPLNQLEGVLNLAATQSLATGSDFSDTVSAGLGIKNAYAGAVDLAHAYKLMYNAQKMSAATAGELSQALAPVVAVTGDLGVSLEDVISAMITMRRQGDTWEETSSLLTNFFTQIQIPGTSLGKAFMTATSGIEFRDYIEQGHDLVEVMTILDKQAQNLGVSMIALVGGESNFYRDAQAGIAAQELGGKHLPVIADIKEQINTSTLEAVTAVQKAFEEPWFDKGQMQIAAEQAKAGWGEAAAETRVRWYNFWTDVFNNIEDVADRQQLRTTATTEFNPKDKYQQRAWDSRYASIEYLNNDRNRTNILYINERLTPEQMKPRADILNMLMTDRPEATGKEWDDLFANTTLQLGLIVDKLADGTHMSEADVKLFEALEPAFAGTIAFLRTLAGELAIPQETEIRRRTLRENLYEQSAARYDPEPIYKAQNTPIGIDGDTIEAIVARTALTVRLPNVNAPELGAMYAGEITKEFEAYGDEATRFTEEWLNSISKVFVSAEYKTDDYGRTIRNVFRLVGKERISLEQDLASAGLALPMENIAMGSERYMRDLWQRINDAARDGKGMFENTLAQWSFLDADTNQEGADAMKEVLLLQQQYLPQSISWAKELSEAEQEIIKYQGEYRQGVIDHGKDLVDLERQIQADLTEEQADGLRERLDQIDQNSEEAVAIRKQLYEDITVNERARLVEELRKLQEDQGKAYTYYTGDKEKGTEAEENLRKLREQTTEQMRQQAFDLALATNGQTDAVLALGVALGLITQKESDVAKVFRDQQTMIAQLPMLFQGMTASAEIQARAVELILNGTVRSAQQAVQMAMNEAYLAAGFDWGITDIDPTKLPDLPVQSNRPTDNLTRVYNPDDKMWQDIKPPTIEIQPRMKRPKKEDVENLAESIQQLLDDENNALYAGVHHNPEIFQTEWSQLVSIIQKNPISVPIVPTIGPIEPYEMPEFSVLPTNNTSSTNGTTATYTFPTWNTGNSSSTNTPDPNGTTRISNRNENTTNTNITVNVQANNTNPTKTRNAVTDGVLAAARKAGLFIR